MKTLLFIVSLVLLSSMSFSQNVKKNADKLKEALQNGGFLSQYTLKQSLRNYSISSHERTIEGDFERYSFKTQIDVTITNFALYEYYAGKENFIVVTIVENGIAKVFVDFDADGKLDKYISDGDNFPGDMYQKEYAIYLSFSIHG